jgi:hypothetical protein
LVDVYAATSIRVGADPKPEFVTAIVTFPTPAVTVGLFGTEGRAVGVDPRL